MMKSFISRALFTVLLANFITVLLAQRCDITPNDKGVAIIPGHWTEIKDYAFFRCSQLKKVKIPKAIKKINFGAFYESRLEVLTFEADSQLETIGGYTFYDTRINSMNIPLSVRAIGKYGFAFSLLLEEVVFETGSQLEKIGNFAFSDTNLKSINIPANVQIGKRVFYNNTGCGDAQVFVAGEEIVNCTPVIAPTTTTPTKGPIIEPTAVPTDPHTPCTKQNKKGKSKALARHPTQICKSAKVAKKAKSVALVAYVVKAKNSVKSKKTKF